MPRRLSASDARRRFRRQLARDPHEGMRGGQPRFDLVGGHVQHAAQQARHQIGIGNLRRHGEAGVDRRAHGQLLQIAVEDVGALGADFDDVLLLPFGAGQKIAVAEQLQIGQAGQRRPASTGASDRGDDQQPVRGTAQIHSGTRNSCILRIQINSELFAGSVASRAKSSGSAAKRQRPEFIERGNFLRREPRPSPARPVLRTARPGPAPARSAPIARRAICIDPRRRAQPGHFQLQFLIQFGRLGALRTSAIPAGSAAGYRRSAARHKKSHAAASSAPSPTRRAISRSRSGAIGRTRRELSIGLTV